MSEKKVSKILQKDSLAESERIFKKDYDQFTDEEQSAAFFKFLLDNRIKKEILEESNDTYMGMPWKDFENLIKKNGFKLEHSWKYKAFENEGNAVIYEKDGFLLIATTSDGRVNDGKIYVEIEIKDNKNLFDITHFSNGFYDVSKKRAAIYYDVREGLMNFIREVNETGVVLPMFESQETNPWLATYEDEKRIEHNWDEYDKLRIQRISESSERIKALCSPFIDDAFILKSNTYSNLGLKYVNLVGNISSIESNVFVNCPNLEEIIIKSDVEIPIDMISNCPNLKRLIVHGVEIPLENGQIKDNSLACIIEGFRTNDKLKEIQSVINDEHILR